MAITHNLGFPRIGEKRELKWAVESFWRGESDADALRKSATELRDRHWCGQSRHIDLMPVGDFSFYDHVLDTSFLLGNLPQRVCATSEKSGFDRYFRWARGRSANDQNGLRAGRMTKWFNTNYHYIVPELETDTRFEAHPEALLRQLSEAHQAGHAVKPVLLGPVSYLYLSEGIDEAGKLKALERLLPVYADILKALEAHAALDNGSWVQMDEPILCLNLNDAWRKAFQRAYTVLAGRSCRLLIASGLAPLRGNADLFPSLPVDGIHLSTINGFDEAQQLLNKLGAERTLSLGVVDGRNIWRNDLSKTLDALEPFHAQLGDRLWLAPSCSLLHVPIDVTQETRMDVQLRPWLAFAMQKLEEIGVLAKALNKGRAEIADALAENAEAMNMRRNSPRICDAKVRKATAEIADSMQNRASPVTERATLQAKQLKLPLYPTTTIGSFPQTAEIRQVRRQWRRDEISKVDYLAFLRGQVQLAIEKQQELGLDVLTHGESERNDMVEHFADLLQGFTVTDYGWVQSYGSRCVKPPIIYGDVARPLPMTVEWWQYAQSLSWKPVKGMLTGPVTLLNWSFVRDDQPRAQTCEQIALAIRAETLDLENRGARIIQVDEAALREGLPPHKDDWREYLDWAVRAFRIATSGVADGTQIHTHMCYSQFDDIMPSIAAMDADVVTIEATRSNMRLLEAFRNFDYAGQIGPGLYDIHSPNVPDATTMLELAHQACGHIDPARLWINPDCGLKTRRWEEVMPALHAMMETARRLRAEARSQEKDTLSSPQSSRQAS